MLIETGQAFEKGTNLHGRYLKVLGFSAVTLSLILGQLSQPRSLSAEVLLLKD
jgi:hypothetical protein